MTLLTPNFAERPMTNGHAGGPHVLPPHEPTREGEVPFSLQPLAPVSPMPAPVPQQRLKIALIGTAPSSRLLAPFNDPSWQIWGCSPGNMNTLPRVDAWFELHSNLLWPEHESYGKPYIEWLKTLKVPVYMQEAWPSPTGEMTPIQQIVPNAQAFPRDQMVAEFGDDFFTSSFAWMMALAIRMGAAEIALYGIDMASREEYIRQRPGFYFFRTEARRRGIKVSAPHESDIMQAPSLYGYSDSTSFGRKLMARRTEITGRLGQMTQQRDGLSHNITYLQGALEDVDYYETIWSGVTNQVSRLQFENVQLQTEVNRLRTVPPVTMVVPEPQLPKRLKKRARRHA